MKESHFVKMKYSLRFLLVLIFPAVLSACTSEGLNIPGGGGDNVLTLNYQVDGGVEGQTYAVTAAANECRIEDMYTLFFRTSGQYAGYTRTEVSSSSSSGTAPLLFPSGENINDEWQLIVLANFDRNAYLDSDASIRDMLIDKVSALNFNEAKKYLTAYFDKSAGLTTLFPMSASVTKEASSSVVNVIFKRRVARIDVHNSASNFILETAQLWNARTRAYLFDEGGDFINGTSGNNIVNYTGRIVDASDEHIEAQLYAFPNFVTTPTIRDHETTCLIISGKYNGSDKTTYYRVNICASGRQQNLKANYAYTLNITNMTGPGEDDPETTYSDSQLQMSYTIDEWDDSFQGTYVFDSDGNGLAVSQRHVIFSDRGNQELQLEVFTIKSKTHPLLEDWSVGQVTGVDATCFSAVKGTVGSSILVSTLSDNSTFTDRQAGVVVTWGSIRIPVNMTQLNPVSLLREVRLNPGSLEFSREGGTRQICVNLQGNFSGVTRENIATYILYNGSETGWLSLSQGTTADDPSAGLFYFNVTPGSVASASRSASIKFVVTKGSLLTAIQTEVTQSDFHFDPGSNPFHELTVYVYRQQSDGSYSEPGVLASEWYGNVAGLPEGHNDGRHLHFPIVLHAGLKYVLSVHSSMGWTIVPSSSFAGKLTFSRMSGLGDPNAPEEVEITADKDLSNPWRGSFYVEYEDGERVIYGVYQEGVFATLPTDSRIYYYGTMKINNKLWLDRNLGATVGQKGLSGYFSNQTNTTGVTIVAAGKGVYLTRAQANTACPPGFRLPKSTAGSGEWDWVKDNLKFSSTTGITLSGASCVNVYLIFLSIDPEEYWLLPLCGTSSGSSSASAYYWAQNVGYFYLSGTSATEPNPLFNMSTRCVRE